VTTLVPTSNGIDAVHCAVPEAVPAPPVEVDHRTEVTPVLSLAVPLNKIEADEAETMLPAGDAMAIEGGVESVAVGWVGCVG
jgi:hypothetical protein